MKINKETIVKGIKKIAFIIAAIALISAVGFYFAFKIFTSPVRLRATTEHLISKTLDRKVVLEDAQLKLGKLVLKNLKIDFREGSIHKERFQYYVSCREVKVRFRIMPLFKKKIIFKKIELSSPRINMTHFPKIDFTALFRHKVNMLLIAQGMFFEVDTLEISDGSVNLLWPAFPETFTSGLNLRVRSLKDRTVKLDVKCMFDKSKLNSLEGSGIIDVIRNVAQINDITIKGYGGEVSVKGSVEDMLTAPKADLKYEFSDFPNEFLPKAIELVGTPILKGEIKGPVGELHLDWLLDLSYCEVNYRDLHKNADGEKFRLQGGFIYRTAYFDINWYLVELFGATVSGTGTIISKEDIDLNIVAESIDLKQLAKKLEFLKKHISEGDLSIKGKLKTSYKDIEFSGKSEIQGLELRNLKGLSDFYRKVTGNKKDRFHIEKVTVEMVADEKKLKLDTIKATGGDIEGEGKGYYEWAGGTNFVLYPRLYGKEIGLRIYGDSGNIKIGLK
ncbi:MAG: hypothetical protein ABIH89_06130 [Elusimicrobiota bacterium]